VSGLAWRLGCTHDLNLTCMTYCGCPQGLRGDNEQLRLAATAARGTSQRLETELAACQRDNARIKAAAVSQAGSDGPSTPRSRHNTLLQSTCLSWWWCCNMRVFWVYPVCCSWAHVAPNVMDLVRASCASSVCLLCGECGGSAVTGILCRRAATYTLAGSALPCTCCCRHSPH
jgi:hypothetical protein